MGAPKALLPFDGLPIIAHVVAGLAPLFAERIVVAAPDAQLPPLDATVVRDELPHQGPVGGICYGLRASSREINFVTACDAVFLSPALVSHLVNAAADYDVVVPHWDGRLQPLHAVYRRTVLPLLVEQLARDELRPVHLFAKVRTRTVAEDEIRRFDAHGASFFNMNTREDYAAALVRWRQRRVP